MKVRIHYLDSLKAILILLVVLGHAVQFNDTEHYANSILFRFIYSFHMPLFFFISGYLACRGVLIDGLLRKEQFSPVAFYSMGFDFSFFG